MKPRSCSRPGCDKIHRAKGLCSTHYNQEQPDRHRLRSARCSNCGVKIERQFKSDRRPVCSPACRSAISYNNTSAKGRYDWASDAERRARAAGCEIIERFSALEIFERDGWRCYLCSESVEPAADCFDPNSPSIDHVIPFAKGGEHSRANARCAHFGCNSAKQDLSVAAALARGTSRAEMLPA